MEDEKDKSAEAIQKLQLLQRVIESQKTIAKLTSRCYKKCVSGSSNSLTNKEKNCLWNCAQNFLESSEFINSRSQIIDEIGSKKETTEFSK